MTEIAKAYGGALFELCQEDKCEEQVLSQLVQLCEVLKENKQYLSLLSAPTIKKHERIALVSDAFSQNVHIYILNFLKVLCENGYTKHFFDCVNEYKARYNTANNIAVATAYTAVVLTEEQKQKLCEKLCKITGKTIVLECEVDKGLVGGIRLQLEDTELDGSVKHRLDTLRANLLGTIA